MRPGVEAGEGHRGNLPPNQAKRVREQTIPNSGRVRGSITQGDKVARRDGPMRTTPRQIPQLDSKLTTLQSGGAEADATPVTL